MGKEAPEHLIDGLCDYLPAGLDLESKGYQTTTILGDNKYLVGESSDGAHCSYCVKMFNKSTNKWLIPTVLGMKPVPSKGHVSLPLNNDRILILNQDASLDDSIWFLEVDTPFVKEQKKLLGTEVVAWSKGVRGSGPKPIVISGPSGVGKGTIISKLMAEFPSTFGFSVSHTTRAPREKERDGVDYHFTERSTMEKDVREGKFLETASVHGNLYGTSIESVEAVADAGKRCILDIDVQGARSVRASSFEAVFIFVCPPSFDELEKRLRARGTETEEKIQERLRNAIAELDKGKSPGLFDHILVNDDLETCYENLKKILALNGSTNAVNQPSMREFKVSECQFESMKSQKVLIHGGINQVGTACTKSLVLDTSMLKGGAPGWTRGLDIYTIDSATDSLDGMKSL